MFFNPYFFNLIFANECGEKRKYFGLPPTKQYKLMLYTGVSVFKLCDRLYRTLYYYILFGTNY